MKGPQFFLLLTFLLSFFNKSKKLSFCYILVVCLKGVLNFFKRLKVHSKNMNAISLGSGHFFALKIFSPPCLLQTLKITGLLFATVTRWLPLLHADLFHQCIQCFISAPKI